MADHFNYNWIYSHDKKNMRLKKNKRKKKYTQNIEIYAKIKRIN